MKVFATANIVAGEASSIHSFSSFHRIARTRQRCVAAHSEPCRKQCTFPHPHAYIVQERDAFFKLAGYIGVGSAPKNVKVADSSAENGKEEAQAMAMTAPVYMKEQSQAMAMTAPVYMGESCRSSTSSINDAFVGYMSGSHLSPADLETSMRR